MKKRIIGSLSLLLATSLIFQACEDKKTIIRTLNVPIYKSKAEIRSEVNVSGPEAIDNAGKIFYKDSYLFISEAHEGIHIINNADPRNPQNVSFLNVPGALDVTIKDNYLYCDNYTDLVVFDISDVNNIQEIQRVNDVFMYNLPEHDEKYGRAEIDPSKGIVVGWEVKEFEEEFTPELQSSLIWGEVEPMMMQDAAMNTGSSFGGTNFEGNKSSSSYGVAGSMSRFAIMDNNLYTLDGWKINVFDITDSDTPELVDQIETWREMETIFPVRQNIFIGTTTGMMIYSLDDPNSPHHVSTYEHVTACDPVVVKDDYAYVTLRTGTACGGWTNVMDVVNISDMANPYQETEYSMTNPHGLGFSYDVLFLCDGIAGLKVYNAENPMALEMISQFPDIHAEDVIAYQDVLMLIGNDGLYQYDYSDINNIQLLSHIGL